MPRSAKCSQESRHEKDHESAGTSASDRCPERCEEDSRADSAQSAGRPSSAPATERADIAIDRFVVGVDGRGSIVACGELAPLSSSLAEIRSLVVSEKRRGQGLGRRVVDELQVSRPSGRLRRPVCLRPSARVLRAHGLFDCSAHLAAGEDHGRLPELSAVQAVRTIRDGDRPRCRCPRSSPPLSCMSKAAARTETRIQTIEGGITAPAGFKAAGVYAGIKPPTHAWPLDVMVHDGRPPRVGGRRVHDEQDAWRRRCSSPARTSNTPADGQEPSSATADARTRARATRAWRSRARPWSSSLASVGCRPEEVLVASTGVIGVDLEPAESPGRRHEGARRAQPRRRITTRCSRS